MPEDKWYYSHGDNQVVGPISYAGLRALAASREITSDTLICREGSDAWIPFYQLTPAQPQPTALPSPAKPQSMASPSKQMTSEELLIGLAFAVFLAVVVCIYVSSTPQFSGTGGGRTTSAAFEETFALADREGRAFRYGQHPKPSTDSVFTAAEKMFPGDEERQKAWRSGFNHGYDNY